MCIKLSQMYKYKYLELYLTLFDRMNQSNSYRGSNIDI